MEYCFKCNKSSEEIRLVDAITAGEIVKSCEDCALSENLPVIRRPTTSQLKESEKNYSVYERLTRISGFRGRENEEVRKIVKKIENVTLDDLRKSKEAEEKAEEERKKPLNLIDNFNWHISIARKKKKLTRKELAKLLGESEIAIKMIENKELPEDCLKLINKLEQFFGIKLKKEEPEIFSGPEIKEETGQIGVPEKIPVEIEEKEEREPVRVLKFDGESVKNITIADLQRLKEEQEDRDRLKKLMKMQADELVEEIDKEEKREWEKESERALVGRDVEVVD